MYWKAGKHVSQTNSRRTGLRAAANGKWTTNGDSTDGFTYTHIYTTIFAFERLCWIYEISRFSYHIEASANDGRKIGIKLFA